MNTGIMIKEFRENKWVLFTVFIFLGVSATVFPVAYSSMFMSLLEQGYDYNRFLWYDWFAKTQPQLALIAAIIAGSTAFAREKKNATLSILITKPLSRTGVFFSKILAGCSAMAVLMAAGTLLLSFTNPMMGAGGIDNKELFIGFLGDVLLVFPVYLVAAVLSIVFLNGLAAGLVSAAVMLLLYGSLWIGGEVSMVWWLLQRPGILNPACAAVLAGISVLLAWMGTVFFKKLDV